MAEIKVELRVPNVAFSSKLRKQGLRDLLEASFNLPIVRDRGEVLNKSNKKKKSKAEHWKMDHPVRKLLYFELKEGNIPLDPNEMGPAEIYCKYYQTDEFKGVDYDELFIQRLKSLRSQVMKEEPLLDWNEHHPARQLIFEEISEGRIPLDSTQMDASEVWNRYSTTSQFKMRGMKFGETFKRRLAALRKQIGRDKDRASADKEAVARAIKNHPPAIHNHRGEPQWNGSQAQQLLKQDIDSGVHLTMKPMELRLIRPQYQEFGIDTFRWKIHQEIRTRKYLHTLKHDAEQKLRKNLKKMTIAE